MDAETYELMCGSGAPADDPVVEDPPDDAAAGALDIAVQVPNECLPIATIEAALPGLAIVEASSNEAPPRGTGFTGLACAYLLGGEDLDFIGYGWEDFNGNDYTQPIWSRRDDLGPEVFIARADGAIGCEIATRWGIQQSAIVTAGATNDEACSLVEVLWGLIDARQ